MKAIVVDEASPDRALRWVDVADPAMGPGDVLIDVHATALNRADLMQRAGKYPPPAGASEILGLEAAGVVAAVGGGVDTGVRVGDRVCVLLPGGGYAERVVAPARLVMPVPRGWSMEEAAALPEVYLTAFVNLFMEGALQPGETVLVHGGASGVGSAAIQLCRENGNPLIVTAGSDEKVQACLDMGASHAVNYRAESWADGVRAVAPDGVDVILDIVGADYLRDNLALLRMRGRLAIIATMGGARAEIDLRVLMGKRLRVIGSLLRSRPVEEKIAIRDAFLARFGPALESGAVRPVIDRVYPNAQAAEAHDLMAANRNVGKIVLAIR